MNKLAAYVGLTLCVGAILLGALCVYRAVPKEKWGGHGGGASRAKGSGPTQPGAGAGDECFIVREYGEARIICPTMTPTPEGTPR